MLCRPFKRLLMKPMVRTKALNALLILLLLLGVIPLPVRAAPQSPASNNSKLFLPIVAANTNQVTSSIKATPILFGATPRKLRYAVGKLYQYDYAVQITSSSVKRDAQGSQADGGETTVIQATANVMITGQEQDGSFLGEVTLQTPSLYRTDGKTQYVVEDAETLKALAIPLRFKQAVNGVITAVFTPADAPAQAVNIQKGILNALQVTLVDGQNAYVAQEQAGQGTVQVQYTLQEQFDGLYITKQYDQRGFAKLVMAGDQDPSLQLQNAIHVVLDRNQGVISSMTYNEQIASGNGAADADGSGVYDGVAAWSTIQSVGRLTLLGVTDAPRSMTSMGLSYKTDSLSGQLTKAYPNREAIDLSQVDLDSELAQLEVEPSNPAHHARILALVEADSGDPTDRIDVLGTIASHLQSNAAKFAVASAYIDVLGSVGTPQAQEILSAVLGNHQVYPALADAPFGEAVQEQALINLSMLKAPTGATVETVKSLLKNVNAELHDTAVTVLGAIAGHLATQDLTTAQQLADLLATNLSAARQPAEAELYLNAIGNAGLPSALGLVKPYLHATVTLTSTGQVTDDLELQAAALVALRKMPGSEAETLLVDALNDATRPHTLRLLVANALHERSDLSKTAQTALAQFSISPMAAPGSYNKSWTKLLGNHDLGVEFPGGIDVASPPAAPNLTAYAYQAANGWIFQHSLNIAKGELRAFHRGVNQVFGAYLSIGGNVIRQFELEFPCGISQGGNLYSGTVQFFDVSYSIPVFAVITLNINVKASGTFTLDWNAAADFCTIGKITLNAGITPKAWATASASAYLDIVVARGGATLSATLLQTSVPAGASVTWNSAASSMSVCLDIKVQTQALSGSLDVWADIRVPRLGIPPWTWKRLGSARLWNFSTPSATYPLLVQCY